MRGQSMRLELEVMNNMSLNTDTSFMSRKSYDWPHLMAYVAGFNVLPFVIFEKGSIERALFYG